MRFLLHPLPCCTQGARAFTGLRHVLPSSIGVASQAASQAASQPACHAWRDQCARAVPQHAEAHSVPGRRSRTRRAWSARQPPTMRRRGRGWRYRRQASSFKSELGIPAMHTMCFLKCRRIQQPWHWPSHLCSGLASSADEEFEMGMHLCQDPGSLVAGGIECGLGRPWAHAHDQPGPARQQRQRSGGSSGRAGAVSAAGTRPVLSGTSSMRLGSILTTCQH